MLGTLAAILTTLGLREAIARVVAARAERKTAEVQTAPQLEATRVEDRRALTGELWKRLEHVEARQAECDKANDVLVARVAHLEAQNATQQLQLDAATARAERAERRADALHVELMALRSQLA